MLKKIGLLGITLFLCSCSTLPGMQDLDTSHMHQQTTPTIVEVHPTLIPITPSLLADQHIATYFYHVAPADVLSISVWRHPELSFSRVANSGTVTSGLQGGAGGGRLFSEFSG